MGDQSRLDKNDDLFPILNKTRLTLIYNNKTRDRIFNVLKLLFDEDTLTAYDLEKLTPLKHATNHKLIKDTEKRGLILVALEEEFRNTGLIKTHYDISEKGVLYLIEYMANRGEGVSSFMSNILPIFRKKQLFTESIKLIEQMKLNNTPKLLTYLIMCDGLLEKNEEELNDRIANISILTLISNNVNEEYYDKYSMWLDSFSEDNRHIYTYIVKKEFLKEVNFILNNNPFLKEKMKSNMISAFNWFRQSFEFTDHMTKNIIAKIDSQNE
ncbi:MAG: hypothetical protein NTV61_06200 [Candidatus Bathyarchaeota archaeon]|nr:hypothetical protein [Candidatus Bathyarchaeota archaeon]